MNGDFQNNLFRFALILSLKLIGFRFQKLPQLILLFGRIRLMALYILKKHELICSFHNAQKVRWGNLIWDPYIPPSRSFLFWRLLHNRVATDENLKARGCIVVSVCCLYGEG